MDKQILQISDVKKSFGKTTILKGINLTISRGEVYGLVGQNGAGKTTLMRIIIGLMYRDTSQLATILEFLNNSEILPKPSIFKRLSSISSY